VREGEIFMQRNEKHRVCRPFCQVSQQKNLTSHGIRAIGQQLGQSEGRLAELRRGLNPLSRFDFGALTALECAGQWQAKDRRSRETV